MPEINIEGNSISLALIVVSFVVAAILAGGGFTAIVLSLRANKQFKDTAEKLYNSVRLDEHRELVGRALKNADTITDALTTLAEQNGVLADVARGLNEIVDLLIDVTDGEPNEDATPVS